jgi:hypothetical protein
VGRHRGSLEVGETMLLDDRGDLLAKLQPSDVKSLDSVLANPRFLVYESQDLSRRPRVRP